MSVKPLKTLLILVSALLSLSLPGTPFADTTVVATSPSEVGDMAYTEVNSQYGLLVWASTDRSSIYGQVISRTNNTPVGSRFVIAETGMTFFGTFRGHDYRTGNAHANPTIARDTNSGMVLVTWIGLIADPNGNEIPGNEVLGRKISLNTAGTPTLTAIDRLSHADDDTESRSASIRNDGSNGLSMIFNPGQNEYLVLWPGRHSETSTNANVYGQRVSSLGRPTGNSVLIANGTSLQAAPEIAASYTGNSYVVAWTDDFPKKGFAKTISVDLSGVNPATRTEIFRTSFINGVNNPVIVPDADNGQLLVVYEDSERQNIYGRWIDQATLAPRAQAFPLTTGDTNGTFRQLSFRKQDAFVTLQYLDRQRGRITQAFFELPADVSLIPLISTREIARSTTTLTGKVNAIGEMPDGIPVSFGIDPDNTQQIVAVTEPIVAADIAVTLPGDFSTSTNGTLVIPLSITSKTLSSLPPGFIAAANLEPFEVEIQISHAFNTDIDVTADNCVENDSTTKALTCMLPGQLATGFTHTFELMVQLISAGDRDAFLGFTANTKPIDGITELDTADNSGVSNVSLTLADLGLSSELADGELLLEKPVSIPLVLRNSGFGKSKDTALDITLPEGVTLQHVEGCEPDGHAKAVHCSAIPDLVVNDRAEILLVVEAPPVDEAVTQTLQVQAVNTTFDYLEENNTLSFDIKRVVKKDDPNEPNDPDDPADPDDPSNPDDPATPSSGGGGGVFGWLMLGVLAVGTARRTRGLA